MSKSLLDTKKGVCFMCGRYGPTENFKEINGFNGKYLIGDHGTVVSTEFRNNITTKKRHKKIKATDNGNGYLIVFMWKDGVRKRFYVHRLVAEHFLEKPEGCDTVNHIDFDKTNNIVSNLEWCTQKENVQYSSERMRHEKQTCKKSRTGEKYIHYRKGRYRVAIKQIHVDRTFGTLEEAIFFREEVRNGKVNT